MISGIGSGCVGRSKSLSPSKENVMRNYEEMTALVLAVIVAVGMIVILVWGALMEAGLLRW